MALGQMLFGQSQGLFRRSKDLSNLTDDERAERFSTLFSASLDTGTALQKLGARLGKVKELKLAAFDEETAAIRELTQGHFAIAEGVAQFTTVQEAIAGSAGVRGITSSGSVRTALEETATTQRVFENVTISQARLNNLFRLQRVAKAKRLASQAKFDAILGFGTDIAKTFLGGGGDA